MVIRKISNGPDYKNAMNYTVGQKVLNDMYKIHLIVRERGLINIYIENNDKEIMMWKSFTNTVPMAIEYNINF